MRLYHDCLRVGDEAVMADGSRVSVERGTTLRERDVDEVRRFSNGRWIVFWKRGVSYEEQSATW